MSDPTKPPAVAERKPAEESLQRRVKPWMLTTFGAEIAADKVERNHRFLEEALELVQACGCVQNEAHQLVDYVYGRPQGEINQEVGGVMITLAALCLANGFDMHAAGETELARIWTKVEQIRAKQAAKPRGSALPVSPSYVSHPAHETPRAEPEEDYTDARVASALADFVAVIQRANLGVFSLKAVQRDRASSAPPPPDATSAQVREAK